MMDVLETRYPAKGLELSKVFVRSATCESSVHCGAGKESAITTNVSSSPSDSLSETGAETATAHVRLVHVAEVRLATLA